MRANGDMLAEVWEKRDLQALLAQRFGMSATIRLSYSASQFEDAIDRLAEYFDDGS